MHARTLRSLVDGYRPPRPATIGNQLVTERGYRLVNINQGRIAMAKRREIEPAGDEGVPNPGNARLNVELPFFASPSISPAGTEAVAETPAEPSEAVGANEVCARSEEHTSELQSRGLISYAVFCLKKQN